MFRSNATPTGWAHDTESSGREALTGLMASPVPASPGGGPLRLRAAVLACAVVLAVAGVVSTGAGLYWQRIAPRPAGLGPPGFGSIGYGVAHAVEQGSSSVGNVARAAGRRVARLATGVAATFREQLSGKADSVLTDVQGWVSEHRGSVVGKLEVRAACVSGPRAPCRCRSEGQT